MIASPLRLLAVALLACLSAACGNLNFYSEAEEARLGAEAYEIETGKYPLVTSGRDYEMVQRVGRRIAEASGKDYEWEFRLLDADVANAFCLPGGKVAVYTGILPITQDEDGLAAVVGHEVAHATERHGGKRMTQNAILQAAMAAVGAGMSMAEMSEEERAGWLAAMGVGAQVGLMLPFSRDHETEADVVGLRYAIRAGYDPYAAVELWQRMAQLGGNDTPSWLSTHPHPADRAENLRALIPELLAQERK